MMEEYKTSAANNKDRRIFARIPIKLHLRFSKKDEEDINEAITVDISANGVGFISKAKLSSDTTLEMWLDLDIDGVLRPLYIKGKVIWSKGLENENQQWRTGVCFEETNLMKFNRIFTRINTI